MTTFKQKAIEVLRQTLHPNSASREIINRIEAIEEEETLDSIIEEIGKDMCQITLIYPNAGMWNITIESHDWTVSKPTLIAAFKEAKGVIDYGISKLQ